MCEIALKSFNDIEHIELRLIILLRYNLFTKYLRPQTYTIIHQHRSTELAPILAGKLIRGDMIKIRCEQAVQHLDVLYYRSVV